MPTQSFEFDTETGSVRDGGIRYLMMRPDVLMGAGTALGSIDQFVNALTESAFQNARASFEVYRRKGLLDSDGALQRAGEFAARLGWGRWSVAYLENGNVEVIVRHSPFAQGIGRCDRPVCGPIIGVLRAVHLVALGAEATVTEIECAAQGSSTCRFRVEPQAPSRCRPRSRDVAIAGSRR